MELPALSNEQLVQIIKHLSEENKNLRLNLLESNVRILHPVNGTPVGTNEAGSEPDPIAGHGTVTASGPWPPADSGTEGDTVREEHSEQAG